MVIFSVVGHILGMLLVLKLVKNVNYKILLGFKIIVKYYSKFVKLTLKTYQQMNFNPGKNFSNLIEASLSTY